jgi:hypothetical protein
MIEVRWKLVDVIKLLHTFDILVFANKFSCTQITS